MKTTLNQKEISEAIGSEVPQTHQVFSRIQADSRTLQPGDLFVALQGQQDGHAFIELAITKKAGGIVYQPDSWTPSACSACLFPVKNTHQAYQKLAQSWRLRHPIPTIVIAGSAGKTTTKELLASMLQQKFPEVLKTQASQNGYEGIPATLLAGNSHHQVAVIEVGIDRQGAMQEHMHTVHPTIAVVTSIGEEHLEKLKDLPTVAQEEIQALQLCLQWGGIASFALDDPWIQKYFQASERALVFSLDPEKFESIRLLPVAGQCLGRLREETLEVAFIEKKRLKESFHLTLPLPGKHNASNVLAATSIALHLGVSPEEIQKALSRFQALEGRSQIRQCSDGISMTYVFCDHYNAQPPAMEAGLETFFKLFESLKKNNPSSQNWVCLGDMLELGAEEMHYHRQLAKELKKADHVLLYGPRMKWLHEELSLLQQKNLFSGTHEHFTEHEALNTFLQKDFQPGDAVFIKGSRGMQMQHVSEPLILWLKTKWNLQEQGS